MDPAQRLANAIGRMDEEQQWALRVVIATERRLRTHFQSSDYETAMQLAQKHALETVK